MGPSEDREAEIRSVLDIHLHICTTEGKLTDRTFDVKRHPRHLGEQVDVHDPDGAATKSHCRRHGIEGLNQHARILLNECVGDRLIFPRNPAKSRRNHY